YAPQAEASIRFDDPDLAIQWPIDAKDILTSAKDLSALALKDAELF
ncbi:MAG: dTDP-4-dehydrorhamnose 3,5-epimerase family protein, partial [Prevotellaceae bacterium]|nr:dTDP-4-dehydrorhamnose 3,5-epimerase family protein [Prevotellaceae bacterium]MDY5210103.1 dTDP-4-dehydrorhamnose 3,5-epimerase family protein [Prevotella sp.]